MPGKRVMDVAPRFKNPKNNPVWKSNLTIDASDKTSGTGDKRNQLDHANVKAQLEVSMDGKCGKELHKRRIWKSDLIINFPEESNDQKQLDKCSVISDWSITEDEKCGKKLDKDIPSKSNLNINSPGESKIQNQLDKCSVISDWSITEEEICGKELDNGISSKSDLNLNSPGDSKDQNQLEKCNVISDWSRTEDDYSESDVGQFMHTLFRKQLYTDITFRSENGEESLSAHRVVLAAKCQFFSKLLFGNKTKEAEDMKMTEEISNLPFNIFKKIVEYFYTDEIDLEDVPTVLDIFFGAKLYQVQSLSEKCESCIESLELTEDNVCFILQMCDGRDIKELRNRCLSYIQENTEKVISSETFRKCMYNTVCIICKLPELSLNSEEQLIDAVAEWAQRHPPHIKTQLIMPLLSNIRFLTLSASELGSIIERHPEFMTPKDALKILIFLNSSKETRNLEKLPTWCNRNTQRRCFKQDNIESALKGVDPKSGKILIPLKRAAEPLEITKQLSSLQIECIEGRHEISGIKVLLPGLSPNNGAAFIVSAKSVKQKKSFLIFQNRFVTTQKEKFFEFFKRIKIRENQVIKIEVVAQSAKAFSLFQLDENQNSLKNEHFQCFVTSEPSDAKQFTVSEVQYGPQEEAMNNRGIPLFKKGVNDCTLPGGNTDDAKQTTKREENKGVAKEENDISSCQEITDEEITSNNEKDKGKLILSCTDTKGSAEAIKEREVKRKEIFEDVDAQVSTSVDENAEHRLMSRPIEEKSGKEDAKKKDVDEAVEDNEVPKCDREKIKSDQGNVNQSTIPFPVKKGTRKYDSMKQEADGETKEKSEKDVESKMIGEGNGGPKTKLSSERRSGSQNLKKQGINAEEKILERDRNKLMSDSENNSQMTLPWSGIKRTEIQDMHGQEVTDKERKEMMSEINRKKATNNEMYGDEMVLSSSNDSRAGVTKITNKHDEADGERNKILMRDRKRTTGDERKTVEKPNKESKVGDEKRKGKPEMYAKSRDNDLRNDKHRALLRPIIMNTSEMEMKQYKGEVQKTELLEKENKRNGEMDSPHEFFFPLAIFLFLFILVIAISYFVK